MRSTAPFSKPDRLSHAEAVDTRPHAEYTEPVLGTDAFDILALRDFEPAFANPAAGRGGDVNPRRGVGRHLDQQVETALFGRPLAADQSIGRAERGLGAAQVSHDLGPDDEFLIGLHRIVAADAAHIGIKPFEQVSQHQMVVRLAGQCLP